MTWLAGLPAAATPPCLPACLFSVGLLHGARPLRPTGVSMRPKGRVASEGKGYKRREGIMAEGVPRRAG